MAKVKSEFYWDSQRERCLYPEHYDRLIKLVMLHGARPGDIDFATVVVNRCIDGALDSLADYSTGGCMALYSRSGRVRLFFEPLVDV